MAGTGLALLPRWLIARELQKSELIDVFPDLKVTATVFNAAAWLLYPSRTYLPLKVRMFIDFLEEKFREGAPEETA